MTSEDFCWNDERNGFPEMTSARHSWDDEHKTSEIEKRVGVKKWTEEYLFETHHSSVSFLSAVPFFCQDRHRRRQRHR